MRSFWQNGLEPSSKILFTLFNSVCLTLSRTRSLYKISIQSVSDLKTKINSKPSLRTKHTKTDGNRVTDVLRNSIRKNAKNRLVSNSYIPCKTSFIAGNISEEELDSWYFPVHSQFNFHRRFLQECLLIWGKPTCCIEFLIDSDDWTLDRKSCSSKTLIKIFFLSLFWQVRNNFSIWQQGLSMRSNTMISCAVASVNKQISWTRYGWLLSCFFQKILRCQ